MFLVFLLYALFASVFIIEKACLAYSSPFFLVGSRMAVAGVLLLGYDFVFNRQSFKFSKNNLLLLFLLGLFNIYLTNIFELWALKYLEAFKTCFIYSLSPFLSALISYLVFSEKMTRRKWLGLVVGCIGFLPILIDKTSSEVEGGSLSFLSLPEIALLLAVVCSVYGWILLRQLVRDAECSPFTANGSSMLVGGVMALIHSYAVEEWNPIPVSDYFYFGEYSLLLIIISNFICYNLYGQLLKRYTATFLSFAGFTTPMFTAFFGWIFLGEVIPWPFYISASIVFLGLFLFSQEELQGGYAVAKAS